jgi:hypothetical protein
MTKLNENNVIYVNTLYKLCLPWLIWILVRKYNLYFKVEVSNEIAFDYKIH